LRGRFAAGRRRQEERGGIKEGRGEGEVENGEVKGGNRGMHATSNFFRPRSLLQIYC